MKQILFITLFAIVIIPMTIQGAAIDDLRKKIQDREAEIKKIENEIVQYQDALTHQTGVTKTLKNEIQRLETEIKKLTADIRLTQYKIEKTEDSIAELTIEIRQKEERIARDLTSLAELMRSINESDDHTTIEILLARVDLGDFLSEIQSFERIGEGVEEKINELHNDKKALATELEKRTEEEATLSAFKNDLLNRKKVQEVVNGTKKTLFQESKNQESTYQKMLKEREARRVLIQRELQTIETQLRLLIDPQSIPRKGSKILSEPVTSPLITQQFGFTDFATTIGSDVYRGQGHNGIDFRASIGTPVLAAADGMIKDFGNTDSVCPGGSYGKWIIVEHANGLSTLYGHLSTITVVKGQSVIKGAIIGYSGDSGYTTGPHVHFTVYATSTYRLAKTQHCGMVPAGGYINPSDYL